MIDVVTLLPYAVGRLQPGLEFLVRGIRPRLEGEVCAIPLLAKTSEIWGTRLMVRDGVQGLVYYDP